MARRARSNLPRTPRWARILVVVVNTLAAIGVATYATGSRFGARPDASVQVVTAWGAAVAAAVALVAVLVDASLLGWIAVGYLLWATLLTSSALGIIFLALAVSLAPVLPRPGGSLASGIFVAIATAAVIGFLRRFL